MNVMQLNVTLFVFLLFRAEDKLPIFLQALDAGGCDWQRPRTKDKCASGSRSARKILPSLGSFHPILDGRSFAFLWATPSSPPSSSPQETQIPEAVALDLKLPSHFVSSSLRSGHQFDKESAQEGGTWG